ncbi:MAG: protein kinase [Planctomycetes bacterium]|nr:protein kinase [Planctomycetota bacterium]
MANGPTEKAGGRGGPRSLVNETLGQFQIKEELGRGGMAVVYKGYQPSLDRWVAIKTLPAEMSGDRDMVSRFHREAEAMVSLNHSNIVQIIDKGQDRGLYYFAMEFVEGPSLKDLLKQEAVSVDLLFDVCTQVCEGLGYAHKKGIIHRDIKPANILYEKGTGLAKVADFGIARVTNKEMDMITLTAQNVGMGTMNYMAPEQKTDAAAVDHRADIYSLGVMIYEMFTGKLPLGKFKLPSQLDPKLPRKLDEVVSRCLETDPTDRYQGMDALRADLQQAREASKGGTLVRSVRDAAERTLTAVAGEQGGKGRLVACCLLLTTMALVGGGGAFFVVDPLKLRGKQVAGGGGGTTTETPPGPATETPPKPATTETPPKPATTETPPKPTTTETPPKPATTETPPKPATETPPKPATESPPNPATETPPNPATETPPPPATETPPKPSTETPPNPATETPPRPATETPPRPEVRRLNPVQLARYNEGATDLDRTIREVDAAARRAGLTGLEGAVADARAAGEAATKLKDEGAPEALGRLEGAQAALARAARERFQAFIKELRERVRAEGGDLRQVDQDYARVSGTPAELARGWGQIAERLHGLRVERLQGEARDALGLATIRADEAQVAPLRGRMDEVAPLQPAEKAAALEGVLADLVALPGPTPRGLKELAKDFVGRITLDTQNPYFFTICPAPGERVAALGPLAGQKALFVLGATGGKLEVVARAVVPLANPTLVAPAGADTYWVAEFAGSTVHRFLLTGDRLVEEGTIDIRGAKLLDLDTAPDGTLWVATQRDVRAFRGGAATGAVTFVERDFCDSVSVPRRVAGLHGGGWALAGHVPELPASIPWGEPELNDQWRLTLRALLPGDATPRQYQPRGRGFLAIAACGQGLLAVQHREQGGGDIVLLGPELGAQLSLQPIPLPLRGHRPELAQDVAVSGRKVYVLDKAVNAAPMQFRRRLVAYEME